ncbi:MAG: hypothetical protein JNJ73_03185 [Hyphomonadaceae bacterium]|nr:hypothetical protein [Hyphomonadaceae bacterium]
MSKLPDAIVNTLTALWRRLLEHADLARQIVEDAVPAPLKPLVASLPDWAVLAIAAGLVVALTYTIFRLLRTGLMRIFAPRAHAREEIARRGEVEDLGDRLSEELASQRELLAAVRSELARLTAAKVAGGAAALEPRQLAEQGEAAESLVAEQTPAAKEAAREIAAGDLDAAIATLERDARADVAAAAEKWRRLGALVMGVNTAKARAAYEEAFKLQPDDFWTCVELARLRQEAGDLNGARAAAECAEHSAREDRDRSVAATELGGIWREAGNLADAKRQFERALDIDERLARDNPGSAEAQRDLSVSLNKLGDVLREGGDLSGAKARYEEGLVVRERLARDNPGSASAQRDLSISYERLGDVAENSGDMAGAIARYEQSLPIARALADKNPSHPGLAKDAEITERRVAELKARLSR